MGINRTLSRSSAAPAAGGGAYQTGAQVAANSSRQTGAGAWSPTVTHLFVLIIIEIAAFAALRYAFGIVSRAV